MNSTTGCPVTSPCSFSANGVAFIGNSSIANAGFGTSGSAKFNVTATSPCFITLVNTGNTDLDYNVQGTNVGA